MDKCMFTSIALSVYTLYCTRLAAVDVQTQFKHLKVSHTYLTYFLMLVCSLGA